MSIISAFLLAFIFSFIGTIPPGTINLSALQLGLENKLKIAFQFSIAASLVEYPYGWIAIRFEKLLSSNTAMVENFDTIGAIVMLVLGTQNFISIKKQQRMQVVTKDYGYAKGLLLGLLNPLAIPYWLGITAYLKSQQWLSLETNLHIHVYLIGVVLGALSFLLLAALLAQRMSKYLKSNSVFKFVPAATLLLLGCYSLIKSLL